MSFSSFFKSVGRGIKRGLTNKEYCECGRPAIWEWVIPDFQRIVYCQKHKEAEDMWNMWPWSVYECRRLKP